MKSTSIILTNFFPFLKSFTLEDMKPASQFDFSAAAMVNLTAVIFQRGKRHDYMIFLLPDKSVVAIPFPASDGAIEKLKTNLLFFGYPVDNVIIKNGGVKSLSSPGEAYVNNKIVLTMKDCENRYFYILIPEYFLAAIFRFCGVVFDGATDIEKPVISISDELESLDFSILHSNNRLFVKYYTLIRRIENEGELSTLLTSLLESGL
jgi:hypothetical protein